MSFAHAFALCGSLLLLCLSTLHFLILTWLYRANPEDRLPDKEMPSWDASLWIFTGSLAFFTGIACDVGSPQSEWLTPWAWLVWLGAGLMEDIHWWDHALAQKRVESEELIPYWMSRLFFASIKVLLIFSKVV